MPRPRNPVNEQHRTAQERYRDNLAIRRGTETDEAHAAIAVAVAIWRAEADRVGRQKDIGKADAIERLAARHLAANGKDFRHALRAVRLRTRRLDVADLIRDVNAVSEDDDPSSAVVALTPAIGFD